MMRKYKIAFVGLGSIAKRHLKNVTSFLDGRGDGYQIDLYRSSVNSLLPEDIAPLVREVYLYDNSIPAERIYDVVFVTNPTSMHYETIERFYKHTTSFFIEKPIFAATDVDESIFGKLSGIKSYVACPLRYNAVLQYVKENVDLDKVYSARAISSSYLPDWRPGQDYRNTYSAHKELGGGVAIDLIHEWDYLTWLFETPDTCYSIQTKISDLEINSEDVALYIAKTDKRLIELHLDYYGRDSIRILQLFMPDDTIECDILHGTVHYLKSHKEIKLESERNAFQMKEIEHFFDIIDDKIDNDSTPEHAYRVLKIAKGEI